jgi:aerobic carbon-monoxide dehydrogenase medium subunit
MIPQEFEYARAKTLTDALAMIAEGAKPLAGGMSLVPLMKLRLASPERVVDIGRLTELNYIREEGGEIHTGATSTHYDVEASPLLRAKCPLLAETASHIGDVQVRNRGTIGGSVAHADPSADYPAALLALEARFRLVGAKGAEREIPAADFFVDTFATALASGEIVREVVVPISGNSEGSSYQKVVQPASGFAIVGVAARVRKDKGKVALARVGVTGLAGKPYRAFSVERALEGAGGSATDVQHAAATVAEGIEANSDLHASADYRKHLARVYTIRALTVALSRIA